MQDEKLQHFAQECKNGSSIQTGMYSILFISIVHTMMLIFQNDYNTLMNIMQEKDFLKPISVHNKLIYSKEHVGISL